MYFVNQNTKAVTENDLKLLYQVCTLLRTFCFVGGKQQEKNPQWSAVRMECHSVARMVSLIFKNDLVLVDGTLLGLGLIPEENRVRIEHTHHSWLRTPDGAIIDPYPMGLIATTLALLIPTSDTAYCIHGGNLYHENPSVREYFDVTQCWKNARSALRTLKKYPWKKDLPQIIADL